MIICRIECLPTDILVQYLKDNDIEYTIVNPTIIRVDIPNKLLPKIRGMSRNSKIVDRWEIRK